MIFLYLYSENNKYISLPKDLLDKKVDFKSHIPYAHKLEFVGFYLKYKS